MNILIFLIILLVLVLAHEFGHFWTAKRAGIRVDEFGFGFPPRLLKWKRGETLYSLNLLPFGGFVKIFGEDGSEEANAPRGFASQPKLVQARVLAAGVFFNLLLAWLLLSASFTLGTLAPAGDHWHGRQPDNPKLLVTAVLTGSPAERAGLLPGDVLINFTTPDDVISFISAHGGEEVKIFYERAGITGEAVAAPAEDLGLGRPAIGISMDTLGVLRLPPHLALVEGARAAGLMTWEIVRTLGSLIGGIFTGASNLEMLTGPIGIVGAVGQALNIGFSYLLFFTAFISINLAVLNLLPFPALDGGRLLFLLIEKIKGSPIRPRVAKLANAVGFALLIALMIAVTFNDLARLF